MNFPTYSDHGLRHLVLILTIFGTSHQLLDAAIAELAKRAANNIQLKHAHGHIM